MLAASTETPKPVELPRGAVMLHPDTIHLLVCTADRMAGEDPGATDAAVVHAEALAVLREAGEVAAATGDRLAVQTIRPCPCGAVRG